mmetsp:Transcript_22704/g.17127  ORF Transcript_22704/g.17127 Transcript_22704/m.17127 type:complete len:202 (+) Transcript_22704:448-1053(+)
MRMVGFSILSLSRILVYLSVILFFVLSTNVISVLLMLSIFLYSLLEYPVPRMQFWQLAMGYLIVEISFKFVYQFPLFCNSPPYHYYGLDTCSNDYVLPETLVTRVDYVLGIHKFWGPASYPQNQGTLWGIFPDLLVVFALFIHKKFLVGIGAWHYVKVDNDSYATPKFFLKEQQSRRQFLEQVRDETEEAFVEGADWTVKV